MVEGHLRGTLHRYEEVIAELVAPETHEDSARLQRLLKGQVELSPLVACMEALQRAKEQEAEALSLLETERGEELHQLAKEELQEARQEKARRAVELKKLLLPKDPNDEKNMVLEIRAGAGGDEAVLFAAEFFRMYRQYAEKRDWRVEIDDIHESGLGGIKEVIATVHGQGAFSRLKFGSGVHHVQRVPATEAGGRIHTSTVSVAVMSEAEEVNVQLNMKDVRINVMRAPGSGGQCVNTTDSAVRLTHYPSDIVIYSQTGRSQLQNKEKAFRLLRNKLCALELERRQAETTETRRAQIGTGDHSEKIRTYNFPRGRVTDHKIKLTLYSIDCVMDGDLDEVLDALLHTSRVAELAGSADSEGTGKENESSLRWGQYREINLRGIGL